MEWMTDNNETVVEFSIKKLWGLITVKGRMQVRQGRLELDNLESNQGSVYVEIDTASAVTGNARRDAHLKTADFFEVERHPLIIFRSQSVEQLSNTSFRLNGELTIRDITRPVTLEVTRAVTPTEGSMYFQASTTLLRHDFGLNFNKIPLGREVMINLKVKAVQPNKILSKTSSKY